MKNEEYKRTKEVFIRSSNRRAIAKTYFCYIHDYVERAFVLSIRKLILVKVGDEIDLPGLVVMRKFKDRILYMEHFVIKADTLYSGFAKLDIHLAKKRNK